MYLKVQAPSDEVVRGVTESISGICGYDIFCQTIVEVCIQTDTRFVSNHIQTDTRFVSNL
jgi:hypothetical protein